MLSAGFVSCHENRRNGMFRAFEKSGLGGAEVSVVLVQRRGHSILERLTNDVLGEGIPKAVAIGIRANLPLLRRYRALRNPGRGGGAKNSAWSESTQEILARQLVIGTNSGATGLVGLAVGLVGLSAVLPASTAAGSTTGDWADA
jgi:sugar (pentulose or hexulose) kinase